MAKPVLVPDNAAVRRLCFESLAGSSLLLLGRSLSPYWGRNLYRHNFKKADFGELADRLKKIRGKFVLSLNDVPALFAQFHIQGIELHYTSQKAAGRRYREVLITNFRA